ncbi:DUF1036 domain-containing protein [Ruegeria sp. 1NDH52C]|uniref:DUF1036 domain-containing protein n=1 Tax=Ruegeria alba TaxID=2916756 RepID=A0ABS9NYC7_9RHOB|nr:DUF1036 domain-containing protein [Ruegeria alba]MCG6559216.1 DUF1036 domain-containing protein [Ruegeria alba]
MRGAATITCLVFAPGVVQAGFQICNDTPVTQSVALAFRGPGDWISQGWYVFAPDQCQTVLEGDLTNRYYYVTALAEGWAFDHHDIAFCVKQGVFDIVGAENCRERDLVTNLFREVDTGPTATGFRLDLSPLVRPADD